MSNVTTLAHRLDDPCVATVTLTLADGRELHRKFFMSDEWPGWLEDPPEWLTDLRKSWVKPQDPIAYTASVVSGYEEDARRLTARGAGMGE